MHAGHAAAPIITDGSHNFSGTVTIKFATPGGQAHLARLVEGRRLRAEPDVLPLDAHVSCSCPWRFASATVLAPDAGKLTLVSVPFVLIGGFLIAAICGYMAGLIGASNSPISGVGILSIVICASVLTLAVTPTTETRPALVAFALFVTAIIFACATISNDNLQDLKTGQLVGASPMRQQIALIVGVAAGAAVIAPVLNLLARAYGFAGAPNVSVVANPRIGPVPNWNRKAAEISDATCVSSNVQKTRPNPALTEARTPR